MEHLSKEAVLLGYVGLQPNKFPDKLVLEAMEFYLRQMAIGFAEWILDNYYCDDVGYYKYLLGGTVYVEPKELFSLYLQSLNK